MSGDAKDLAEQSIHYPHLKQQIKQTVELTVQRFGALLGDTGNKEGGAPEAVRCLNVVFNHDIWPETATNLAVFGERRG